MAICGVDEAGRGPVLGPLVVAGALIGDDASLRELGVRDSKKLSPHRREELEREIRRICRCEVIVLPAAEIDALRDEMSLNRIEAKLFATIIERLAPETAYVDSADTVEENFARYIRAELKNPPKIVSEHRADDKYPVVSAASIVAKVRRDAEIARIEGEIGEPIGSGYPSDPGTVAFIEKWIRRTGTLPPHARRSWSTIIKIQNRIKGTKLEDWG